MKIVAILSFFLIAFSLVGYAQQMIMSVDIHLNNRNQSKVTILSDRRRDHKENLDIPEAVRYLKNAYSGFSFSKIDVGVTLSSINLKSSDTIEILTAILENPGLNLAFVETQLSKYTKSSIQKQIEQDAAANP